MADAVLSAYKYNVFKEPVVSAIQRNHQDLFV